MSLAMHSVSRRRTAVRISSFSLWALLALAGSLPAESPNYEVEILIFENLKPDTGGEALVATGHATVDASSVGMEGGRGIQPLPRGPYNLQAIYDAMRRSSQYRPLLHWAWRQPGWPQNRSVAIQLQGSGLGGYLTLIRSRYLHLSADVIFNDPLSGTPLRLREIRRMRSGELHYFDHPRYGILARITPL